MTDTEVGTVELLTRAADAAGRIASDATQGEWHVQYYDGPLGVLAGDDVWVADCSNDEIRGSWSDPYLIAASGPDHWRAVEAMFRDVLAIHQADNQADDCVHCWEPGWLCATLEALRPLAEQVLQHLGDTE